MTVVSERHGRFGIPEARSPFPLAEQVPAMLASDPLVVSFLDALDEVIAPTIGVLDCFDAYLDPRLAPPDMVAYLGSWVLALIDDTWDESAARSDVVHGQEMARWSGTKRAIEERLRLRGASAEIIDPGATLASTVATDRATWTDPEDPTVIVRWNPGASGGDVDPLVIQRAVSALAPAHVVIRVEAIADRR